MAVACGKAGGSLRNLYKATSLGWPFHHAIFRVTSPGWRSIQWGTHTSDGPVREPDLPTVAGSPQHHESGQVLAFRCRSFSLCQPLLEALRRHGGLGSWEASDEGFLVQLCRASRFCLNRTEFAAGRPNTTFAEVAEAAVSSFRPRPALAALGLGPRSWTAPLPGRLGLIRPRTLLLGSGWRNLEGHHLEPFASDWLSRLDLRPGPRRESVRVPAGSCWRARSCCSPSCRFNFHVYSDRAVVGVASPPVPVLADGLLKLLLPSGQAGLSLARPAGPPAGAVAQQHLFALLGRACSRHVRHWRSAFPDGNAAEFDQSSVPSGPGGSSRALRVGFLARSFPACLSSSSAG